MCGETLPTRGPRTDLRYGLLVALVLVLVAGAAIVWGRSGATNTTAPVPGVAVAAPSGAAAEPPPPSPESVRALTVQPIAVGIGIGPNSPATEVLDRVIPQAELDSSWRGCLPDVPPGRRVAGVDRQYSEDLQSDGAESAHITSITYVYATRDDALMALRRIRHPDYSKCLEAEEIDNVRQASGSTPTDPTLEPLDSQMEGLDGAATRLTLHYQFRGEDRTYFTDDFEFVTGRVQSIVIIGRCCHPYEGPLEGILVGGVNMSVKASPLGQA